jgi:8-oxo-dGTP pyrophosphatase MutT (NUDIX family)
MDGISFLQPLSPELQEMLYERGNAHGWLARNCKTAATNYQLAGRLYVSKTGYLLLSVPNALVRGVFDAMTATGAELPTMSAFKGESADGDLLNAHITVMTDKEVEQIGKDKINERGHTFKYSLGPVREFSPRTESLSRVWAIEANSPDLAALRRSYGLTPLPNEDHQFHITVAVRRKRVLAFNEVAKIDGTRGELKAAAHEGAPWGTPTDKLPWRERVEVYAHDPKGRIYGGIWNTDKSFAVPGGGIDPGEDPGQAAIRELEEETGIKATNPRVLPIAPVDNAWSDKHRQEKQRNFAGSRTHFVAVDVLKKLRNKQLDKWDAARRKFYDPTKALTLMEGKQFMAPSVAAGRIAALKHILENAAKKTAADLLPGGAADNMPDNKFSKKELAAGVADEHEHTNNDQIAKEIAKDHLQEEPHYYSKQEEIAKQSDNRAPSIILKLREAKAHSDAKRYDRKNAILRDLMLKAPNEWYVDDPLPYHMGVTHDPTKFKFHADPVIIPPGVKVRAKAASEPYLAQLNATPIAYNKDESVWRNFVNHLMKVKANGDHQLYTQQRSDSLLRALDPARQQQHYAAIARGEAPKQPSIATQIIHRHGGNVLASL